MTRLLVVGYGNPLREDEGAGWWVGQALKERWASGDGRVGVLVDVQPQLDWAADLAEAEVAVFVDAEPVTLNASDAGMRWRALSPADSVGLLDGHAPGPADLLRLARLLYGRAPKAHLLSIPAQRFGYGEELSSVTRTGVDAAIARLARMAGELREEAPLCV